MSRSGARVISETTLSKIKKKEKERIFLRRWKQKKFSHVIFPSIQLTMANENWCENVENLITKCYYSKRLLEQSKAVGIIGNGTV